MKKKIIYLLLLIPVLIVILVLGGIFIMSPPGIGKNLAADLGIPHPAIIAHRGASYLAPESTTPAYTLAREMGVDYLEADLQRTKDGVIIAFHDDTPARTTNVAKVFPGRENDFIETFTYEELMELDTGSWFNEEFPDRARDSFVGLKILTLEELIDIAENGSETPGLYLETKSAPRHLGIEAQIVEILENENWLNKTIFQSFFLESLELLEELAPQVPRVFLISSEMEDEEGFSELIKQAKDIAQGVGPIGYLGFPQYTGKAHRAGLIVHNYTINASWQMRLLSFFGSDGFFTDNPEIALEILGKSGKVDVDALFKKINF